MNILLKKLRKLKILQFYSGDMDKNEIDRIISNLKRDDLIIIYNGFKCKNINEFKRILELDTSRI